MDNMEALGITVGDITVVGILGIAALMGMAVDSSKPFSSSRVGPAPRRFPISLIRTSRPVSPEYIQTQRIAEISAAAAVFIVALIVLFFVFSRVWKRVKESEFNKLGPLARITGWACCRTAVGCFAYLAAC